MHCKRHETRGKIVFAFCDKDLIGKKFEENGVILDLNRYRDFYKGSDINLFQGPFQSINAVGKKSTDFLVNGGLAKREDVRFIQEVPVLQIYGMKV
jgi:hypothetical protein